LPPAVSIITVYYNNPDDMLRLAASMKRHLQAVSYEWIIADNNSTRNLSSELSDAIYIRLPENLGFGAACNRAAERATAPALFFVNPDCEFVENCINVLLGTTSSAAAAGPRVIYPDGMLQLSFGPFLSISAEARQKIFSAFERTAMVQRWLRRKTPFQADYVSGCALMIRADIFKNLNGFDENFFLYNEDVDLCKRVCDLGQKVIYNPAAKIVHIKNTSTSKHPSGIKTEFRKSQKYYYQKHLGRFQNALLSLYSRIRG
jgi:GT2 family glycosyltransferase